MIARSHIPAPSTTRSFTLTELLVAMAVITVLAVVTLVSVRAVARDARLASATNTVMASLDNARALAMKHNQPVLVAFFPRVEGVNESRVDVITAAWSGDSAVADVSYPPAAFGLSRVFDRFRPLPEAPVRPLPRGIKVAGPSYVTGADASWLVMSELTRPITMEAPGEVLGVMYGPDGTMLMNNSATDADYFWIDLNGDGDLYMDLNGDGATDLKLSERIFTDTVIEAPELLLVTNAADEAAINLVPFLAVYDDEEARELYDTLTWTNPALRTLNLSTYITDRANRVHFNRYTGVAMR